MGLDRIELKVNPDHFDGIMKSLEMLEGIYKAEDQVDLQLEKTLKEWPEADLESMKIGFGVGLCVFRANLRIARDFLIEEIERGNYELKE